MKPISEKWFVLAAFLLIAAIGTFLYKDYGVSWDEESNKSVALAAEKYILHSDPELFQNSVRYYGTSFEFILLFAERIVKPGTLQNVYFLRHQITFYFFLIGVFFFYLLARIKFSSVISLLGAGFLVLSPRIFADAFYNAKDIPFLAAFIASMYTLQIWLNQKTLTASLIHAASCAFLISLRVVGVLAPALTVLFLILDLILDDSTRKHWISVIRNWLIYSACVILFTILLWPYLWEHPIAKFAEAYRAMSHFNWGGTVLYFGRDIKSDILPWHYIPVWMLITTPILYSVFFAAGFLRVIISFIQKPTSFYKTYKLDLMCLAWLLIPIVVVIQKHSVLYDGWRQLFFVYPAFLLITLEGVLAFMILMGKFAKTLAPTLISLLILANSAHLISRMTTLHPFENLYFNRLAGKNLAEVKHKFDLDYWGLSFREALEFILAHDTREIIKIHPSNLAGDFNAYILAPSDQKRLVFLREMKDADYFMTNYRWHHEDYDYQNEVFSAERGGAKIVSVFKLK